jgi:glycerophosphoryl diester phosphodiesterase
VFRFETFGDEQVWTGQLHLNEVVEKNVDPTTALKVGLKVDADALPAGILLVSRPVDPVAVLRAAGARDLWQDWELLDAELVRSVHDARGRVIAWTVNDPAVAAELAHFGVDGICTDVPDVMVAALCR